MVLLQAVYLQIVLGEYDPFVSLWGPGYSDCGYPGYILMISEARGDPS